MKLWKKDTNTNRSKENDNRINVIMAVIFLLGGSIIFKLYSLQVSDYDLYIAKAIGQHEAKAVLEAERGRIFIQDNEPGKVNKYFPLASNKKFALLFAIPEEMEESEKIAEKLYFLFKEEQVKKEVEYFLQKEDKDNLEYEIAKFKDLPDGERAKEEERITKETERLRATKEFMEARKIRIEAEIKKRQESLIIDYLKILNKKDDPYEPLEQKIDEKKLKEVYASILSREDEPIDPEKIILKNDILYLKDRNNKEIELKIKGIDFRMKVYRYYPEGNVGSQLLGFVSYANEESKGQYGLEGFFNDELTGKSGSIKTSRSAGGELIIANDREYQKPVNGSDLILTIDRAIQFTVCEKLSKAVLRHGADSGSVVIMNPKTGGIIAMCSSPDYDPNNYRDVKDINIYNNPVIFDQYEPGSIFKAITMSMPLDQEKVTPQTTFNDTGVAKIAGYEIKNSDLKAHGVSTMNTVLELSLNTGAIFAMKKVGPDIFTQYVKNYGFGEKTGIELEGESLGDIRALTKEKMNRDLYAATASFGQGIAVSPLQMVSAFSVIANGGVLMKPYVVQEIIHSDGTKVITQPKQIRRVISERASMLLGGMLVNVVENGHGQRAGVKGYYVAGKTGTAQIPRKDGRGYEANAHNGSFAGFAPVNDPAFVMLVRIEHPRDVEWAESSAAPLFGEIAEYLLNYWQIPSDRTIKDAKK